MSKVGALKTLAKELTDAAQLKAAKVFRATKGSPRGDIKGNAVHGKGTYFSPNRDIVEIYGQPEEYLVDPTAQFLRAHSPTYNELLGHVDVHGTWLDEAQRSQAIADMIQSRGYHGVLGPENDIDGSVLFNKDMLQKVTPKFANGGQVHQPSKVNNTFMAGGLNLINPKNKTKGPLNIQWNSNNLIASSRAK